MVSAQLAGETIPKRKMWEAFSESAIFTTAAASHLVKFANINIGDKVLDVGTGTGVVSIIAARAGAEVTALDHASLLELASKNARIAKQDGITFVEGDIHVLPFPDASFDVVLSQFGHVFAADPHIFLEEARRVLKPGGRIALASWSSNHIVDRMITLVEKTFQSLYPHETLTPQWGTLETMSARLLAAKFKGPLFDTGTIQIPTMSVDHYRLLIERSISSVRRLVYVLKSDPKQLKNLRQELNAIIDLYYVDNAICQNYILSWAIRPAE
jgi:SAM-dependent methyltransferase